MTLVDTRTALSYVGCLCEHIREQYPDVYETDRRLFDRLDYFTSRLDKTDQLEPVIRVVFFRELEQWCLTMQNKFLELIPVDGQAIH